MNYNPNAGARNPQGFGRKVKHVSDVNAMGMPAPSPSPPMQNTMPYMMDPMSSNAGGFSNQYMGGAGGGIGMPDMNTPAPTYNGMSNTNQGYGAPPTPYAPTGPTAPSMQYSNPNVSGMGPGPMSADPNSSMFNAGNVPQFGMFQQPIVQDMALQYGQRLADQGKQIVEDQLERWISVSKLKYYFAVDNRYVINKLRLIFFPFTHRDWSLKYDQEKPVQPRYDINAPDLYIPTMAYITYVVVAGLMLGLQNRFSPEQLGIQASSALACSIFELIVYSITLYVSNIKTNLKTLDLVAFTGYKFVIIVACLLVSTFFHGFGYYVALVYCSLSLGFFLLRTLRTKVLQDSPATQTSGPINYDPYGNPQQLDYRGGRKRKLYFLFLIVGGQALFSFFLSKHLYFPDPSKVIKAAADAI